MILIMMRIAIIIINRDHDNHDHDDKWSIDMDTNEMRAMIPMRNLNIMMNMIIIIMITIVYDDDDDIYSQNLSWFFILNFSDRNTVTNVVLCQFLLRQLAVSENSTCWSALYQVSGKHTFRCVNISQRKVIVNVSRAVGHTV